MSSSVSVGSWAGDARPVPAAKPAPAPGRTGIAPPAAKQRGATRQKLGRPCSQFQRSCIQNRVAITAPSCDTRARSRPPERVFALGVKGRSFWARGIVLDDFRTGRARGARARTRREGGGDLSLHIRRGRRPTAAARGEASRGATGVVVLAPAAPWCAARCRRLPTNSIVTIERHRGAFVSAPTIADAQDIFFSRRLVESGIALEVARQNQAGRDRAA